MSDKKKIRWIGDDGDNKSANINRKIYSRGEVIPAGDVAPDVLAEWFEKGLVAEGDEKVAIIVTNKGAVANLEAEIRDLKAKLDAMPGLEKQNAELKKSLEKAQSGKKADAVKLLEDDIKEKAARIDELVAEVEALTEPDTGKPADDTDTGGNDSGGPS